MDSPTWYFDGDLRRAYEVPPDAGYVTDGEGYRIYDGGPGEPSILTVDVQKDLWSRWVDWMDTALWSRRAFGRSGGALRPTGEYAPNDYQLFTSLGWRLVMANYPHETVMFGNLFPEGADSLFDNARLSVVGVVPRLQGSANLLTYPYSTGAPVPSQQQIRDAMALGTAQQHGAGSIATLNNQVAILAELDGADFAAVKSKVEEIYLLYGLDIDSPLVVSATERTAGVITQSISELSGVVTVQRE